MPYHREVPEQHRGCRAQVGEFHEQGCDVERCARCGGQAIACACVYEVNGIEYATLETTHPDLYVKGATDAMYERLDEEIEKLGGRLPRTRSYPGVEECEQLGWFCIFEPYGDPAWKPAERDDLGDVQADLNRFARAAQWDPQRRLFVVDGRALPVRGWAMTCFYQRSDEPLHDDVRLRSAMFDRNGQRYAMLAKPLPLCEPCELNLLRARCLAYGIIR